MSSACNLVAKRHLCSPVLSNRAPANCHSCEVAPLANTWRRREPEGTVLYRVLAEHLETFLARIADDNTRTGLPRFVVRELRDYLKCGILAHGFCRVHCTACGSE